VAAARRRRARGPAFRAHLRGYGPQAVGPRWCPRCALVYPSVTRRDIFTEEHEDFRDLVREFLTREVTPFHAQWEKDKVVPRSIWLKAGQVGLLGIDVDEKYRGGGNPDFRYYAISMVEVSGAGADRPSAIPEP
jgi:Acyl-CoA dehydrogenase, N-terminal domain